MDASWPLLIDLGIISVALLLATLIRVRVRFFQHFLIPNALTAGFLLLPFYNFAAPALGLSTEGLGQIVYHLMCISFVSMTLRKSTSSGVKRSRGVFGTAAIIIFQYGAQGLIGLLLTALLIATMMPDLFPSFGLFVPLGFALGPGQAYSIGTGWEAFGFFGAGTVGLTFAAVGYLLACFVGVFLVNWGRHRGWAGSDAKLDDAEKAGASGVYPRDYKLPTGSRLTTQSDAIDSMSLNLGVTLATYLLSYLGLTLITWLLSFAGELGTDLAVNLWGINFVFATITALGVKVLLTRLGWEYVLDSGTLARISGVSVDLMVAAAVGAISLVVVGQYWVSIVIVSVLAGAVVFFSVPWMASRLFLRYQFHRTLIIFGAMTGTLPTGLALLRIIDPHFETPVASDYVYTSALVFVLVIPLILAINLPAYSVTRDRPFLFWLTVIILGVYVLVALAMYAGFAKRRTLGRPTRMWYAGRT
jgi:ESS family glutamate:Na+ symporter